MDCKGPLPERRAFSERLVRNLSERRKDLAIRLKLAREEAGYSQYQVARTFNYRQDAISRIETGRRQIDAVELETFAFLYGKTLDYFATWSSQQNKDHHLATVRLAEDEFQIQVRKHRRKILSWQGHEVSKRKLPIKLGSYPPYPQKKTRSMKP
jgi:transcriptional regulator with XRE-family HTH domain